MRRNAAGFLRGLAAVWRGARLLRSPRVRPYVLAPLAVNVGIFLAGAVLLYRGLAGMAETLLPPGFEWLSALLLPVVVLCLMLAGFFSFSVLANLLATPFNGTLSGALLRVLRGRDGGDVAEGWAQALARGLVGEVGKTLYFLKLSLPALLLLIVPGLNFVGALLWSVLAAWLLALEYMDCVLGNLGQPWPSALETLRARRGLALGLGTGLALVTAMPLLNLLAMPIGVAAATLLFAEHLDPASDA